MNLEKIKSLHSRYKPQLEAERYVSSIFPSISPSLPLNEKTRFLILIEPGLGYLIAPLKKRFPAAKLIALHAEEPEYPVPDYSVPDYSGDAPSAPDAAWHPGTGMSVQDFLEREIPDSGAPEIRLVEWRPSLSLYGDAYLALIEETAQFIKRADASSRTLKAFGRSWFKNFFKNLGFIKTALCPLPLSMPLLVTGAGPGLEGAIPLLKARRAGLFILAASSSAAALLANDLLPDMLIATDGGGWARFHLYECLRAKPCVLAAAMTAALPSQCETLPILPISDGSLWQALILEALGIPFVALPQRGTVSATALDIAFALAKADIFVAGFDLENMDIRSHARPYSLDRFLEEKENRLNPVYSQSYLRSSLLKAGGSYGIYASWFEKQIPSYPKKLYSLGKNNPLFGHFERAPEIGRFNGASALSGREAIGKTLSLNIEGDPSRKACLVLEKALKDSAHSAALLEELGSLLLPGREGRSLDDLIDAVRTLTDSGGKRG